MNATQIIVRCKCEGKAGAAKFAHCYQTNKEGTEFYQAARSWSPWARCWTCRSVFKCAEVRGKFSSRHVCGAKCLASKGPTCECSCGGKNHGGGFA
jgi:hypothetical protein